MMSKWKTRHETWNKGKEVTSQYTEILCGSLQINSCSPADFRISEITVCKLLQESKGHMMGEPKKRNESWIKM